MTTLFNKSSVKQKRKQLRNQMPSAEVILWSRLQKRQMSGFKFRRQYSVGNYVLDFYCPEARLAIEIDGDSHFQNGASDYDSSRQKSIEQFGIRFLRFTNLEIYKHLNKVLESIKVALEEKENPGGRKRK
jgi:very-short-patch-repair endonuclease